MFTPCLMVVCLVASLLTNVEAQAACSPGNNPCSPKEICVPAFSNCSPGDPSTCMDLTPSCMPMSGMKVLSHSEQGGTSPASSGGASPLWLISALSVLISRLVQL